MTILPYFYLVQLCKPRPNRTSFASLMNCIRLIISYKIDSKLYSVVTDKNTGNWKYWIIRYFVFPSQGDLVYVNYGRIEDFLYLTQNMSIDLKGKTLIARYGKIFRGDKVRLIHVCVLQVLEGIWNNGSKYKEGRVNGF